MAGRRGGKGEREESSGAKEERSVALGQANVVPYMAAKYHLYSEERPSPNCSCLHLLHADGRAWHQCSRRIMELEDPAPCFAHPANLGEEELHLVCYRMLKTASRLQPSARVHHDLAVLVLKFHEHLDVSLTHAVSHARTALSKGLEDPRDAWLVLATSWDEMRLPRRVIMALRRYLDLSCSGGDCRGEFVRDVVLDLAREDQLLLRATVKSEVSTCGKNGGEATERMEQRLQPWFLTLFPLAPEDDLGSKSYHGLMNDVFSRHDPRRNRPSRPELQTAIVPCNSTHHRFVLLPQLGSSWDAARVINGERIDILIDLLGHLPVPEARRAREVVAFAPSSTVINAEGFHGTTGDDNVHYNLVDRHVAPPELRSLYSESFLMISTSFHVNSHAANFPHLATDGALLDCRARGSPVERSGAAGGGRRADVGVPHEYFKIDPPILCCWLGLIARMRTKGVEVSLNFQQKVHHEEAIENLVSSAGLCGLRGMRDSLRLLEPQPTQLDYLKLLCSMSLMLDTPSFNAHTTAVDALWAGLPLLAVPQIRMVVTASMLLWSNMSVLVARDLVDYSRTAEKLLGYPDKLAWVRQSLKDQTRDGEGRGRRLFNVSEWG
ncbi:hypothetical protein GUITHDRAFT_115940 [Guillardia theta CCMP2712]|uniref:O-GlcNAc transferase C-terminal domain-containing protein n=1 Tax=Guillardia theta (strain CCMP2712) TaxID=905079 RepID=L1IQ04_GUITC|nr:hypothetical protein GUITHDRAFT_115940 [Guillardia theta CCMP2712]EKX37969.1 hypothetical protein GUITHDRAFT_115940 [Guillardia theta CCMP2712]|eukprot:XP_005824949.1 hypothetical protein GUITHDRAFT_115940 [Guillardia theta CCMP2712]